VVSSDTLSDETLEVRAPTNEDVPALRELWWHEEGAVDMALEPGMDLPDWLSSNPAIRAAVYTRDGLVVGYTRISTDEPTRPRVFLARDGEAARAMVRQLGADALPGTQYILPLHPFSASAHEFGGATCTASSAAQACSLGPSPLNDYLAQVQDGRRPPGRVVWPVAFDLD
jgi:hypothetical protein